MDSLLNVFDIKLLFFSSEFNETCWSCSTHRVLQLHQVSLHSDEKVIVLYQTHLTDSPSVRGRWIWPKTIAKNLKSSVYLEIIWLKKGQFLKIALPAQPVVSTYCQVREKNSNQNSFQACLQLVSNALRQFLGKN